MYKCPKCKSEKSFSKIYNQIIKGEIVDSFGSVIDNHKDHTSLIILKCNECQYEAPEETFEEQFNSDIAVYECPQCNGHYFIGHSKNAVINVHIDKFGELDIDYHQYTDGWGIELIEGNFDSLSCRNCGYLANIDKFKKNKKC